VVDFVRREVAQGTPLGQICENIMEHCLAPDTHGAQGIGCDNMTILIVAILNGKSEEEWYAMIRDRVVNKIGFSTPDAPPQIYSAARLMTWRTRRANVEALEREEEEHKARERISPLRGPHPTSLDQLTRVISDSLGGGISFHPGSSIMSDSGVRLFADEEESDEERANEPHTSSQISAILLGSLSDEVVDHELAEDLEQDEPMDEDEESFGETFDRVIDLSVAERNHAEIRANGVHGDEHDTPSPSSASTQEPPSPPPHGETPLLLQLASGHNTQKPLSTLSDGATAAVDCYLGANGDPLKG
jgi:protein phosphatase PTC2/3